MPEMFCGVRRSIRTELHIHMARYNVSERGVTASQGYKRLASMSEACDAPQYPYFVLLSSCLC